MNEEKEKEELKRLEADMNEKHAAMNSATNVYEKAKSAYEAALYGGTDEQLRKKYVGNFVHAPRSDEYMSVEAMDIYDTTIILKGRCIRCSTTFGNVVYNSWGEIHTRKIKKYNSEVMTLDGITLVNKTKYNRAVEDMVKYITKEATVQ